ncbi:hypothetical protein Bca4012_035118 [Brassica carinata]|uniref:Uncharacterized protein n=1 Tax=Brassica carinata TaxID=52824 RepID=A0A8X8B9A9_BRACI|nr:hypothetical protein Bca52824_008836 [Brassica carinata]
MRCKRHIVDFSSSIGVCASCLRERLFSLAASTAASEDNDHSSRISPLPRPLVFPRSVSPYVSARKSDAGGRGGGDNSLASSHNRFFPTPQVVGSSSSSEKVFDSGRSYKKKQSRLSRFSSLFRTRSDDSYDTSTSSSRAWLSKVFSVRSKKPSPYNTCYIEDLIASESRPRQRYCRGMSPAGDTSSTVDYDLDETPERVKRTPATAMGTPGRRKTTATIGAGMGFCLSPLVRAKPNSSSSWRGKIPPEFGYAGELKSPARPHISTAASFCANRSKKLVDLGRVDPRR